MAAGRELGKGVKESGWFDDFWQSLIKWIAVIVGTIAGAVIKLLGWAAVFVARTFLVARAQNEDTLAEASAAAVQDLFGVPVSSAWFKSLANRDARLPAAKSAAEGIVSALGGSFTGTAATGIQPSSAGAEKYLTTVTHLAIEGWLEGWIMEVLGAGQIETFAQLKDIFAEALGLGRMTRRVLAAPLKILVEDPFTWKLNALYRPALLPHSTAVRQFLRSRMTREQLDTELGYEGFTAERIEALINEGKLHLPAADLAVFVAHHEMDRTFAVQLLKDQGYEETQAEQALRVEYLKRGDTLSLEIARLAIDAWSVDRLSEADLSHFINQDGISEQERTYLGILKDLKSQVRRKQFSLLEAEKMVRTGIWGIDRFRAWAAVEGYTIDDERDLELLTFGEIKTASDAAAKRAALDKERATAKAQREKDAAAKKQAEIAAQAAKGVQLSKYETLVKDGIRTVEQYRAFLVARGVSADNQDALVSLITKTLTAQKAAGAGKAANSARAAAKNLNLGELDKAVRAEIITPDEYVQRLTEAGFDPLDVDILLETAAQDILSKQARSQAKADAAALAAVKHVDLAQEQRAVRLGFKTIAQFRDFLASKGFADDDAALLADELQKQLAQDAAAAGTRKAAQGAAKVKGLSLVEVERAVRAGLKTTEDYRAMLAALGFDADAQDTLVSLLQLQIDTDKQQVAARGQAAAVLGERGVSLLELERAVKVGVVDISVYTDALGRAGLSPDDAKLLTLTLAAQVASAKKTAKGAPQINTTLRAAGLSLASLRSAVLQGRLSVEQFTATLTGAGVDPQEVAAQAALLGEELANQQAVQAKRQTAIQRAAAKGLSLAQEEAAVKADVKTLPQFEQFVGGLGFDAADVATLTDTLAAQLSKAAKPKGKTPPPAVH